MTPEILRLLAATNLAAGAAVLVVLVLRAPVRRWFGANAAYALWLAVPLAALAIMLPARVHIVIVHPEIPVLSTPTPLATTQVAPAIGAPIARPQTAPRQPVDGHSLLLLTWLAGVVASLGLLVWNQGRFVRGLGRVRNEGPVRRAQAIGVGPAVVGALFPRIVVPADFETRFGPDEQRAILAHENAHLRGGHAQVNGLAALTQCLCWFNPLIHLAAHLLRIDQELACDAAVLGAYPNQRRLYAGALLKTQLAARILPLGCYWPARSAHPLKARIAMLKRPARARSWRIAGVFGALGLSLVGGLGVWAAQPAQTVYRLGAGQSAPPPMLRIAAAQATAPKQSAPASNAAATPTAQTPGLYYFPVKPPAIDPSRAPTIDYVPAMTTFNCLIDDHHRLTNCLSQPFAAQFGIEGTPVPAPRIALPANAYVEARFRIWQNISSAERDYLATFPQVRFMISAKGAVAATTLDQVTWRRGATGVVVTPEAAPGGFSNCLVESIGQVSWCGVTAIPQTVDETASADANARMCHDVIGQSNLSAGVIIVAPVETNILSTGGASPVAQIWDLAGGNAYDRFASYHDAAGVGHVRCLAIAASVTGDGYDILLDVAAAEDGVLITHQRLTTRPGVTAKLQTPGPSGQIFTFNITPLLPAEGNRPRPQAALDPGPARP